MYLMDPDRGARRRALARDRARHVFRQASDEIGGTTRDLRQRARGRLSEARTRLEGEPAVDDEVLTERVRSALGRAVSHPGAIIVTSSEGRVRLEGPVLMDEVDALVHAVERVRGVEEVYDELEIHAEAGGVAGLQGKPRKSGTAMSGNGGWSPMTRLVAGLAGGAASLQGFRRRGPVGMALGFVGAKLLRRAVAPSR